MIVADAQWLAHRYDPHHDAFHFRRVPRAAHAAAVFLTDEYLGSESQVPVLTRGVTAPVTPPGTCHFIFHSAFCASTMLTRVLDQPGVAMGLSEPVVLNDLVGWRRRGADMRVHARVMGDALALLARPFEPAEPVVVKPSSVINPLAAGMLALRPDARAILLFAPLPVFLASVARKGLWCRLWCRELLEGLIADGVVDLGFDARDYFRMSDLQVAAVGWLAQHKLFSAIADRFGAGRVATLDSEQLTRQPVTTIVAVADHLGIKADASVSSAIAAHPALGRNSKTGAEFAPGQRERDQAASQNAHQDEIDKVVTWAEAIARTAGIAMVLPHPLPG